MKRTNTILINYCLELYVYYNFLAFWVNFTTELLRGHRLQRFGHLFSVQSNVFCFFSLTTHQLKAKLRGLKQKVDEIMPGS